MSYEELDRVRVIERVIEKRLTQVEAARIPRPTLGFSSGNRGVCAVCESSSGSCIFQSSERIRRGSPRSTSLGAAVDHLVPSREREAIHAQRDERGEEQQQRGERHNPSFAVLSRLRGIA